MRGVTFGQKQSCLNTVVGPLSFAVLSSSISFRCTFNLPVWSVCVCVLNLCLLVSAPSPNRSQQEAVKLRLRLSFVKRIRRESHPERAPEFVIFITNYITRPNWFESHRLLFSFSPFFFPFSSVYQQIQQMHNCRVRLILKGKILIALFLPPHGQKRVGASFWFLLPLLVLSLSVTWELRLWTFLKQQNWGA